MGSFYQENRQARRQAGWQGGRQGGRQTDKITILKGIERYRVLTL